MTVQDLIQYEKNLQSLKDIPGTKFGYMLLRNLLGFLNILKKERAKISVNSGIFEYEKKRIELCKKYSDKNAEGKPEIDNNKFLISEKKEDFKVELKKLMKPYLDIIKEVETEEQKFLNKEIETKFYKIKKEDLPDCLSANQIEILMPFVEEDKK